MGLRRPSLRIKCWRGSGRVEAPSEEQDRRHVDIPSRWGSRSLVECENAKTGSVIRGKTRPGGWISPPAGYCRRMSEGNGQGGRACDPGLSERGWERVSIWEVIEFLDRQRYSSARIASRAWAGQVTGIGNLSNEEGLKDLDDRGRGRALVP